jgi:acetylornithine deacetylase
MGRVLQALEQLDRELQAGPPHPLMGAPSLHASLIAGGRELSSYPDRCALTLERRTIPGEDDDTVTAEMERIVARLRAADPEFEGTFKRTFSRPPYALDAHHALPQALYRALCPLPDSERSEPTFVGMSFWTDAAVLGSAGIPSVLFGPGGAGLHSVEEYVNVQDVLRCRDALAALARAW